ncbi:ImmA/IrrE family metallo-endopeptidase [Paralcaligenes sp. KSB-10]|uniref:ImmA/IrrE family metallo-endopeptidase n=1 Tax=Paralcaligenes sp. KSB-10 TaxID=2901142 RepID=UPI001E5EEF00|nr:ImmA/IrrE family metallo-endopeptidase [Paralcaligenes sp. KSB-10]UHL62961.1 ImmA/IrrE family metallo-endopeptidase [Paralcaligenes sp. KSB-10]
MELKIIKTEADYRLYLGEVERLALADPSPDSSAGARLELISLLVEEYEKGRFRFDTPSPIEAIQFRMHEQGLRQADLVPYFGSRSRVSEVLAGKRPLTVQMIREVSMGLGISADVLVANSTSPVSEPIVDAIDAEIDWNRFPIKEMERHGYFNEVPKRNARALSELARDFVTSILPSGSHSPILARQGLRGDAVNPKSRYGLLAWKARVLDIARKRKARERLSTYHSEAINPAFLTQVVHLSWHQNGMRLACELIEGKGIPIVIEPHLAGTQLDGAAFLDQDGTPVIGLTFRFDRIDYFWFTLLHELAHVMKHLSNPGDAFLDRLEDSEATEVLEVEANRIARDALIPRAAWRRSEVISAPSRERIMRFAKEQMIHPAIVAGRVRRESGNFRVFGDLLGMSEVRNQFPEVSFK